MAIAESTRFFPECGEIIGRAEYADARPSYLMRYIDGSRNVVERWWGEDALVKSE